MCLLLKPGYAKEVDPLRIILKCSKQKANSDVNVHSTIIIKFCIGIMYTIKTIQIDAELSTPCN